MITGVTRLAAVIGSPVRHSLSPTIHNAAFAALGLDWRFVALDVDPGRGAAAVDAMRTLGIAGLSVTMPHKSDVLGALDRVEASAAALGAVNCIAWDGDALVGHNTDGSGFIAGIADDLELTPAGRRFGVIGAGGAARAVIGALSEAGAAEVVVVNRDRARGEAAAAQAPSVGRVADEAALAHVEIIVNATPVGMTDDAVPFDVALLRTQTVIDLVYQPRETPLLAAARARGLPSANGVSMLVHQAAHASTLWTGRDAPIRAIRAAIEERNP